MSFIDTYSFDPIGSLDGTLQGGARPFAVSPDGTVLFHLDGADVHRRSITLGSGGEVVGLGAPTTVAHGVTGASAITALSANFFMLLGADGDIYLGTMAGAASMEIDTSADGLSAVSSILYDSRADIIWVLAELGGANFIGGYDGGDFTLTTTPNDPPDPGITPTGPLSFIQFLDPSLPGYRYQVGFEALIAGARYYWNWQYTQTLFDIVSSFAANNTETPLDEDFQLIPFQDFILTRWATGTILNRWTVNNLGAYVEEQDTDGTVFGETFFNNTGGVYTMRSSSSEEHGVVIVGREDPGDPGTIELFSVNAPTEPIPETLTEIIEATDIDPGFFAWSGAHVLRITNPGSIAVARYPAEGEPLLPIDDDDADVSFMGYAASPAQALQLLPILVYYDAQGDFVGTEWDSIVEVPAGIDDYTEFTFFNFPPANAAQCYALIMAMNADQSNGVDFVVDDVTLRHSLFPDNYPFP